MKLSEARDDGPSNGRKRLKPVGSVLFRQWAGFEVFLFSRIRNPRLQMSARAIGVACAVVGGLGALYTSTNKWRLHSFAEAEPCFFAVALVFVVHCGYLMTVSIAGIFAKMPDELERRHLFFPVMLTAVYVCTACEIHIALAARRAGTELPLFQHTVVSVTLFAVTYVVWLVEDIRELRAPAVSQGGRRSTRAKIWIILDAISAAILFGSLLDYFLGGEFLDPFLWKMFGIKDIVVSGTLLGYLVIDHILTDAERGNFRLLYSSILANTVTEDPPTPTPSRDGRVETTLPASLSKSLATKPFIRVVDFGGANGKRAIEILLHLGVPLDRVELVVVEIDGSWREEFLKNCKNVNLAHYRFTSATPLRSDGLIDADMIIGSHLLHDLTLANAFFAVLRLTADSTAVCIRGCGTNSLLGQLIYEVGGSGLFPKSFYRWNLERLEEAVVAGQLYNGWDPITRQWIEPMGLSRAADLDSLPRTRDRAGCVICVVKQWLFLSPSSIEDFCRFVALLYRPHIGDRVFRMLGKMFLGSGGSVDARLVMLEDWVFLYEVRREPGRLANLTAKVDVLTV
jgi:hypothetical protein